MFNYSKKIRLLERQIDTNRILITDLERRLSSIRQELREPRELMMAHLTSTHGRLDIRLKNIEDALSTVVKFDPPVPDEHVLNFLMSTMPGEDK